MFSRRNVLRIAGGAAAAQMLPGRAFALDYPTRPVHVAITTAPGGSSDIVSRLTGQFMSDRLGQTFLMENRPGAGGNIATDFVHRAPADGYSLLAITKGNVVANLLYNNLAFDFMSDFIPIAGVANGPLVMLVNPSVPAKTLPEYISYAKANPTKLNFGTAGNGTDPHLSAELFKILTGIEMAHVPFRGGALALTDLLGGGVQVMFSNLPTADYVKQGKLTALGVTTAQRSTAFPDLPAIAEVVPGFDMGVWFAYVARKGTPPEIVDKLNAEINASLADPKIKAGLAVLTAEPMVLTTAKLGDYFASEYEKWAKVIKAANIKPE
jgi:tripartite-type tricarboxylate transporter receptor subunit TctC